MAKNLPSWQRKEKLLALISSGVDRDEACQQSGIKPGTIRTWLNRDPEFYKQWNKLVKTTASYHAPAAVEQLVELYSQAVDSGDFKAARRILRDIIEISGNAPSPTGGQVSINAETVNVGNLSNIPTEELMTILEQIAGAGEVIDVEAKVTDASGPEATPDDDDNPDRREA